MFEIVALVVVGLIVLSMFGRGGFIRHLLPGSWLIKLVLVLVVAFVVLSIVSSMISALAKLPPGFWLVFGVLAGCVVGSGLWIRRHGWRALGDIASGWSDTSFRTGIENRAEPFLGRQQPGGRWRFGTREDNVGVVAPARAHKTSGLLIPQAMIWDGPLVSVSVFPDILEATGDRRQQIAAPYGGRVLLFDPTGSQTKLVARKFGVLESDVPTMHWSPISGCDDPEVAITRAHSMVFATKDENPDGNVSHFKQRADVVLRCMLHAAAVRNEDGYSFRDVVDWIHSHNFIVPAELLRTSNSPEAERWSAVLLGLSEIDPRERGGYFSTAANALAAFDTTAILQNCSITDIDFQTFASTRSSLFVVAGMDRQEALAPLFSGFLEALAFGLIGDAANLPSGRLDPPLMIQLDEVANIAPLPNLERLMATAGGRGICLVYAAQNLGQLASRYGEKGKNAIWQATKAKVIFGGLLDKELEDLAKAMGVRETTKEQWKKSFLPMRRDAVVVQDHEDRLRVDEIYGAEEKTAHLFYRTEQAVKIKAVPYYDQKEGQPFYSAKGWHLERRARVLPPNVRRTRL